jgi:nickel transport protein
MKPYPFILFFSLLMVSARIAQAHDFWIERQNSKFLLRYGHPGGQAIPMDEKKIKSLQCLEASGKIVDRLTKATFTPNQVSLIGTCLVLSSFQDGGYYSLTPDGEKNLAKNQVPDAVKSWRSKQYAKWVDSQSSQQKSILGDEFEIVPVTNLAAIGEGDKATFQVLLQGKPISGATLTIDHKPIGETDDMGHVRIRVRGKGTQSVSALFRRPLRSSEADSEVFESSLSFEVVK